jgi:hypothetical protein
MLRRQLSLFPEIAAFLYSFPVMAPFRHRFPILPIPEQLLIPTMRDDVIDNLRLQPSPQDPACVTFAVRMLSKILPALDPPFIPISSLRCVRPVPVGDPFLICVNSAIPFMR